MRAGAEGLRNGGGQQVLDTAANQRTVSGKEGVSGGVGVDHAALRIGDEQGIGNMLEEGRARNGRQVQQVEAVHGPCQQRAGHRKRKGRPVKAWKGIGAGEVEDIGQPGDRRGDEDNHNLATVEVPVLDGSPHQDYRGGDDHEIEIGGKEPE